MSGRINWVDYSKGLGIILVVYGHVMRGLVSSSIDLPQYIFTISDKLVYSFHMPLFFFLSGLFVEKSLQKDLKSSFLSKLQLLIYPYVIWSILQGGLNIFMASHTNNATNLFSLLKIVYEPIGQFWFLYVLFFMFLIYQVTRKRFNILPIWIFSIILYLLSPYLDIFVIKKFVANLVFFISGSLLVSNIDIKTDLQKFLAHKYIISALLGFSALIYILISTKLPPVYKSLTSIMAAFSGIYITVYLSNKIADFKKAYFIKRLGELSLVIYLVHVFATSGSRIVLYKLFQVEDIYTHIVFGTLLGIVFPICVFMASNKLNLNNLLFGMKK